MDIDISLKALIMLRSLSRGKSRLHNSKHNKTTIYVLFICTQLVLNIGDYSRHITNMRLTLDILKRLDEFEFVEEVTGDYTGTLTGLGASHEPKGHRD